MFKFLSVLLNIFVIAPLLGEPLLGVSQSAFAGARARPSATPKPVCKLRILHTNDLHSHLDHAADPTRGNFAALKAKLDERKRIAREENVDVLTLDAGDFSEGSEFYFANQGRNVFEIMNHMGYDATVVGNHDWLAGQGHLDWLVANTPIDFAFLGANFVYRYQHQSLRDHLKPHHVFERAGSRIAVLGLTTDEFFYSWRTHNGYIGDPIAEAQYRLRDLKRDNDYVIALTHLGIKKDRSLVRSTRDLDLVVGGHSHTLLTTPEIVTDREGKPVPILQAGEHGQWVGELEVSVCPRGMPGASGLEVLSYVQHPIYSEGPKDPEIEAMIAKTHTDLDAAFAGFWDLNEAVGVSEVDMTPFDREQPEWGDLVADAIRKAGRAEISADIGVFGGLSQPAGIITRKKIIALYPHTFDFTARLGWNVWVSNIRGRLVKTITNGLLRAGQPFNVSGMTIVTHRPFGLDYDQVKEIYIGGKPIEDRKRYKMALPEALIRGPVELTSILRILFDRPTDTGIPIWKAIEDQIKQRGTITRQSAGDRRIAPSPPAH